MSVNDTYTSQCESQDLLVDGTRAAYEKQAL